MTWWPDLSLIMDSTASGGTTSRPSPSPLTYLMWVKLEVAAARVRRPLRRHPVLRRRRLQHGRRTCGGACSTQEATALPGPSAENTSTSHSPTLPQSMTGFTVTTRGASTANLEKQDPI